MTLPHITPLYLLNIRRNKLARRKTATAYDWTRLANEYAYHDLQKQIDYCMQQARRVEAEKAKKRDAKG